MTRRRIGMFLLMAGSAALLWCLMVMAGAAIFQWYQQRHLPHVPATGPLRAHDVIGMLEVPRLHLSTVVVEGDDDGSLVLGAGHVPGTALPEQAGNVGIAAHRDTFFRPLRHIAPHDRITLTTASGVYDYTVESTQIVRPSDVQVLSPSRTRELTLVTCYPFYYVGPAPKRFVVHARRTVPAS